MEIWADAERSDQAILTQKHFQLEISGILSINYPQSGLSELQNQE
ncbi:MAG: hypothetical protein QNL70_08295 [Pseudomonas sp.]